MTLPFEKPPQIRKYQCFVCGRSYDSFEEFKGHILEKHEENKDYILCPCTWCLAPVRDLKTHWKIKHANLPMPKFELERSIVWRDSKEAKGGKNKKKVTFRKGWFASHKMGKEFYYRSGLECEVYEILELLPYVLQYDVEPIEIPYLFEGNPHKYTPDLAILYDNNSREITEIKPSSQTRLPQNIAKWEAAEKYCLTRGWQFNVLTEQGVRKLKKRIKGK